MAPLTKKSRTGVQAATLAPAKRAASRIFQPFREIGHVTSDVPVCMQQRGKEEFVTVAVGHCFQIYDCANLRLKFVSEYTEHAISGLEASGDFTFAACGRAIIKFQRAKRVGEMVPEEGEENGTAGPRLTGDIVQMLVFGDHLLAVYGDNIVRVWDWLTCEEHHAMEFSDELFRVVRVFHPSTYLNKMLLLGADGRMQLWNIKTRKMIYEFRGFGAPITAVCQSPVVDVVAFGLLDGRIVVHDLRKDETLFTFRQEDRVTSLSFRTDEHAIMASGGVGGDVALWDLEERRLAYVLKDAHDGVVTSTHFFNGKPIMLTAGADNTLKEWMFDSLDGLPRPLRSRSGHHAPPTFIRYYDAEGRFLLSAARDRSIRLFSIFRDEQNLELSQGHLQKKAKSLNRKVEELRLPFPVEFSASPSRERDWDNVLSCHLNTNVAKTWSFDRKALGQFELKSQDGSNIKSTAMSQCGNFGLIGCASGRVDLFNMQSGLFRKQFGARGDGHRKPVTGIACDANNRRVVTSSIDGTIKLWDFNDARCLSTVDIGSPVSRMLLHASNNLLAVAADDLCVRIVDVDTAKVVREFWGHDGRVTDMTFNPDGRWLVSCALDGTVRTWDLPSGYAVDRFKVESIATSVTFSPSGDFLATSHVNSVGICLWANRTQFSNVMLRRVPDEEQIASIAMPAIQAMEGDDAETENVGDNDDAAAVEEAHDEDALIRLNYQTPEQLADGMITLSMEPKSKWQTLLNLDTIKKRNKPREAPKAPEKAPFFLPTVPGLEPKFLVEKDKQEVDESRVLRFNDVTSETVFTRLLVEAEETSSYATFFHHVKSMSPSALDFELRSLDHRNDFDLLRKLLRAIHAHMATSRDFELLQSYLAIVLKIHGDLILANPDSFYEELAVLLERQREQWSTLEELFQKSLCLVDFIRNV